MCGVTGHRILGEKVVCMELYVPGQHAQKYKVLGSSVKGHKAWSYRFYNSQ